VFTKVYKRYALLTLTVAYTLSVVDQGLITLLLQPIKEDLHLSDTQLGVLTGIAFGLLYRHSRAAHRALGGQRQ